MEELPVRALSNRKKPIEEILVIPTSLLALSLYLGLPS
jgi:hypothetical protein